LDYVASASDEGVLRLPPRTELDPNEVASVFGWDGEKLEEQVRRGVLRVMWCACDVVCVWRCVVWCACDVVCAWLGWRCQKTSPHLAIPVQHPPPHTHKSPPPPNPNAIKPQYFIGAVIGAGSFGTVRECIEALSGERYAVKTVSKLPKRGPPTPRYLLKLRAEVDVMRQVRGCWLVLMLCVVDAVVSCVCIFVFVVVQRGSWKHARHPPPSQRKKKKKTNLSARRVAQRRQPARRV
jgi:hypothetical protein